MLRSLSFRGKSEVTLNRKISRNKQPILCFFYCTLADVLLHFLFHCVKPFSLFFFCKWWNSAPAQWPVAWPCGSILCPILLIASPSFPSSSSFSSSSASSSLFQNCSKGWICPWDTRTNPGKASQFNSVQLRVDVNGREQCVVCFSACALCFRWCFDLVWDSMCLIWSTNFKDLCSLWLN